MNQSFRIPVVFFVLAVALNTFGYRLFLPLRPAWSTSSLSFCNSKTCLPIALESCSNTQKMWHVFHIALKKIGKFLILGFMLVTS